MGATTCQTFEDRLGDYLDRRLSADDNVAMDAHMESCGRCRDLLVEYRGIPGLVRKATDAELPAPARALLRRLLAHARRRRI